MEYILLIAFFIVTGAYIFEKIKNIRLTKNKYKNSDDIIEDNPFYNLLLFDHKRRVVKQPKKKIYTESFDRLAQRQGSEYLSKITKPPATESFTTVTREQGSEALSQIPMAVEKQKPKRKKITESFTNKGAKQASEKLKKIPNPHEYKPMSSDTPGLRALQEGYKPPRATEIDFARHEREKNKRKRK